MDDYSLVLFEKSNKDKTYIEEIATYKISYDISFIKKFYMIDDIVYIIFDTEDDNMPDWKYTAVYDNFNEDIFVESGYEIETIDTEYLPTWCITIDFLDDYNSMLIKLNSICNLISTEIHIAMKTSDSKKNEYEESEIIE